jgi:chemotaxis signal transduction protein
MKDASAEFSSLDQESLKLLLERAERVRSRKKDEALEDGGWVLEFSQGMQSLALPLEQVLSCIPLKGVIPVPLSKRGVVGIMRWQGKVLRVLSLASLLGSRGWRRDPSVLLILKTSREELAIDCEEIPRAGQLAMSSFQIAREKQGEGIVELALPGGKLLRYLNLEALLKGLEA